jgi:hypothetical protein
VTCYAGSKEVTASGGPLRLLGFQQPLCFPSPFSVIRNKDVTISYSLSDNSDIDIYILSSVGEVVKKISVQRGQEGGKAASNKVKWNGITDIGRALSNGIYLGTIIAKPQNKIIGKFKLTAYN